MDQTGYATTDLIRYLWRHRLGNAVPAAVLDCWDEVFPVGRRPLILKQAKTQTGWWFMCHLPPGLTYADFRDKAEAVADAVKGAAVIERRGRRITLEVATGLLLSRYDFDFDPTAHKGCLPIPLGYSALGPIVRDLADAPHLLIAGNTGSGKSNLLHTLAVSLLLGGKIRLAIIDFKRLEFSYLRRFALLATEATDAARLLTGLNKELNRRLDLLEKAGVVKWQSYSGDLPYIVLIIDELAELGDKDSQNALNRLLRLSRAAGISVIAATQRPSSTTFQKFGDSKALFGARACFKVPDGINSRMVIDSDKAALLPTIPGRAILDWGSQLEIQAMYLPPDNPAIIDPILARIPQQEVMTDDAPSPRLAPRSGDPGCHHGGRRHGH